MSSIPLVAEILFNHIYPQKIKGILNYKLIDTSLKWSIITDTHQPIAIMHYTMKAIYLSLISHFAGYVIILSLVHEHTV